MMATCRRWPGRAPPLLLAAALLCGGLGPAAGAAGRGFELSGWAGLEWRWFPRREALAVQHGDNHSLVLEPELYRRWDGGRQSLAIVPHLRLDQGDGARSFLDLREAEWLFAARGWELRAGVRKVFWGVAESQHLVDVINQVDFTENLDTEDRLGQPMVNFAWIGRWGTLDLFWLPYFRERRFPSRAGRLRFAVPIAIDRPSFESAAENWRQDFAVRWSQLIGNADIGIAHFHGTSREPRFLLARGGAGQTILRPRYDVIDQTSLDLQYTAGRTLWKLELLRRAGWGGETFVALTGGFEHTRVGVLGTAVDVGVLAEYLWDERGDRLNVPFADDLFAGLRISLNDVQSTRVLAGAIVDRRQGSWLFTLEASRRLGARWTLEVEGRLFNGAEPGELLHDLRRDDYLQIQVARHW